MLKTASTFASCAVALALTGPVFADENVPDSEFGNPLPVDDDQWRYSLAFPMVWAPEINGRIRGDERIDFKIPFSDIIDKLSFGMMFEFYATRGPFGLVFRSNYMETEDEESRSGLVETRVETSLTMGVHDLMAAFRIHPDLHLTTGLRYVHARVDVDFFLQAGDGETFDRRIRVTDDSQLDYLVGVSYDHFFNERWGLMLNADYAIAGDNDRDYGFDGRLLYRISDLNNLWFGWRYLNIGSDSFVDGTQWKVDMSQSGPTVGWAFTFR